MKKAIIIGAGPAGLTAAYQLLKETDIKPVILEETEYIGGISRTAEYKGNRMDLGGHRFFSKVEQVNDIWTTLMPMQGAPSSDDLLLGRDVALSEGGPNPEKTDIVSLVRTRVSRIFFLRKFFDYPISMKPETFINMGLWRTLKAGFGYLYSCAFKREEKSLEDFYINRFGKPLYSMFFEDYTEKLWGVHPSNIAPDWGAQRVKELSIGKMIAEFFKKLFNPKYKTNSTSLIEQFMYPKKGPGQLWEKMADEIRDMGGEIIFNTKATRILQENGVITGVEFTKTISTGEAAMEQLTDEKTIYSGDYYFSTMPVKDLVIAMGEDAPSEIHDIAKELPYRDFITVGLLVNKLLLKNKTNMKTVNNIVPDCWIYIQERDVKIGRLQVFNNWSPYMPAKNEETVWVGLEYFCNEGDDMWNMSSEDFINFAISELVKIDVISKDDVLDATHIRVKKAYPAYFGTYKQFDKVQEYLSSFANLFCIGRNGQHRYNNMDHSMLTAIEAVNAIKSGSTDKRLIWNVNTEKEYHETKEE
ncbi:MAG: NAD(P)/FAD-dependent oxidoreductase [Lachnospiraceae bacterium]|nr:NAD(P)/FAD-dependent oxidoreductase [Lachnospiraceae bacterium]